MVVDPRAQLRQLMRTTLCGLHEYTDVRAAATDLARVMCKATRETRTDMDSFR
jgi:hypothetical protein